jgi:predicted RNA-binding Zn-ribbon protein involved in translation (DUF1610 family)
MQYPKYLKDSVYYYDLYDRFTVERGLRLEKSIMESTLTNGLNPKVVEAYKPVMLQVCLYTLTGERYRERSNTIQEWIEKDRRRDERYENTQEPHEVRCKFCDKPMEMFDKSLEVGSNPERVVFFYRCVECGVGKKVYECGEVNDIIPWKCPQCSKKLTIIDKKTSRKITSTYLCSFCGYKHVTVLDLTPEKPEVTDPEKEKQYRIDKDRFCLSDKDGQEYIRQMVGIQSLNEIWKEKKGSYKCPPVKELTISQVEKLLKKELPQHGYTKLSFGEPQMARDVVIDFRLRDETDRVAYDSRKTLKKLLNEALTGTNWKLMNEGVDYRVGILKGRLRTLEKEPQFIIGRNGEKILL